MPIQNQINREPQGLLSLFRAKVGGRTPQTIADYVQPVVDVTPFQSVGLVKGAQISNTGNPPFNINIPIPQGQYWLIHNISLEIWDAVLPAGEDAIWRLELQGLADNAGTVIDMALGLVTMRQLESTVGGAGSLQITPGYKFIAPSGVNIQAQYVSDTTTGNYNVTLAVLYSELRA